MYGIEVGMKRNKDRNDLLQGKVHDALPECESDDGNEINIMSKRTSKQTLDPFGDTDSHLGSRSALGLMSKRR
jgi:hypothetical protein